jgi:hypothetical protein
MRKIFILLLLVVCSFATHKTASYYYNEGSNGNRCKNDRQCDGLRTCSHGKCKGTARPTPVTLTVTPVPKGSKTADYKYNEAWNGNKCKNNWECDGLRTCSSFGWCQGTARPTPITPPVSPPVTPPSRGPKTADYKYNEAPNGNKCTNDWQCDGLRTCSTAGWCQGTARPTPVTPPVSPPVTPPVTSIPKGPKTADYQYNEAPNGNKCTNDWQCDGLRTCSSFGWCQGVARSTPVIPPVAPPVPPTPTGPKTADYQYNETPNGNKCTNDWQCDGLRTCSAVGWCQGTARPTPVTLPVSPPVLPTGPKTADYKYDEATNGNKCQNDLECNGRRTCSPYGWCQGTA